MGRWAERAKELQLEATRGAANGIVTLKPSMVVHYQIPVFKGDSHMGWMEQIGRIQLIDERGQGVIVTPLHELEPWRWVSTCYVQPKGND